MPAFFQARSGAGQFARFVLVGAINTGVSYVVFLAASLAAGYQLAYLVAYAAGIVSAYALNTRFVFRTSPSFVTAAAYPLVYAIQYLAGALVLHVAIEGFAIAPRRAALLALLLTVPISFALNRLVLNIGKSAQGPRER